MTAERCCGINETLSQVNATVQLLNPYVAFFGYGSFTMDLSADTQYQVVVVSKPGRTPPADLVGIPVIGTVKGSTEAAYSADYSTHAEATVSVTLAHTDHSIIYARADSPYDGVHDDHFNKVNSYTFRVGLPMDVVVSANLYINLQNGDESSGPVFATADPSFEIDPTFPYADDFEIEYSPGFGTATPEPSTRAMMLLGFVGLGFAGYRRSRSALLSDACHASAANPLSRAASGRPMTACLPR